MGMYLSRKHNMTCHTLSTKWVGYTPNGNLNRKNTDRSKIRKNCDTPSGLVHSVSSFPPIEILVLGYDEMIEMSLNINLVEIPRFFWCVFHEISIVHGCSILKKIMGFLWNLGQNVVERCGNPGKSMEIPQLSHQFPVVPDIHLLPPLPAAAAVHTLPPGRIPRRSRAGPDPLKS